MPLLSRLQPDSATTVGILTAAGVYLIYQNALPNVADIRSAPPHDSTIESSRKGAAWKSLVLISAVFLVARDLNSYIISGAALVGVDYMYKHANAVHPATGKLDVNTSAGQSIDQSQAFPLPEYGVDEG
jgi:hypothetical protein